MFCSISPQRDLALLSYKPSSYQPIAELAREELKLAGLRIDPHQNSRSRMGYTTSFAIAPLAPGGPLGPERPVTGIPEGAWMNFPSWHPRGRYVTFTVRGSGLADSAPRGRLSLWAADVASCEARPLLQHFELNPVFVTYCWLDDETLVAAVIPPGRGPAPARPLAPLGPKVQSNTAGRVAQSRTFTDLLKGPHDEALFLHYCSSTLVSVNVRTGAIAQLGSGSRLYTRVDPSPDGKYLLVETLEEPFSYAVPCGRFPSRLELWTADGSFVRVMADLPLADAIPILRDSVRTGPRGVGWRPDSPATLYWAEAQDGGDKRVPASPRDRVFSLDAAEAAATPNAPPGVLFECDNRYGGILWGDSHLALGYESWFDTRTQRIWALAPGAGTPPPGTPPPPKRLWRERNWEDEYSDPGSPMTRRLSNGSYVLALLERPGGEPPQALPSGEIPGRRLLLEGAGAGPEGYRPFVDIACVDTGAQLQRLFQSSGRRLESPGSLLSDAVSDAPLGLPLRMLLSRESPEEQPQYHILSWATLDSAPSSVQITDHPHPHPQLLSPQKEILRYKRSDGVDLTATLFTPPGWTPKDGPLPTLFWAYPVEFKSKEAAGQMRESPFEFSSIGAQSPLVWLAHGYAVLDGPTLPIVAGDALPGAAAAEPNDSYVEQLVAGARAAVEEAVRRGVTDPARVAVGGRSYGAFMTANLLAHAGDLFACGIACSGAYNRTLTPFGFQEETRTLWEAPGVYAAMSPFNNADVRSSRKPAVRIIQMNHVSHLRPASCPPRKSRSRCSSSMARMTTTRAHSPSRASASLRRCRAAVPRLGS